MKFSTFADFMLKLDQTSKRLEITSILKDLITDLSPEETDKAIYLAVGYLEAPFAEVKFNIAEKMMVKILEQAYATKEDPYIKGKVGKIYDLEGDLGNVAYELSKEKSSEDPKISQVYQKLLEIALTEGGGSQEGKISKTAALLKDLDRLSAKYITRIILGTMRLGFTETTVVDALAQFLGDKTLTEKIEAVYNIHPDIGLIAKQIKEKGIAGLRYIQIETGVPVLSQKCQRVSGLEEAMDRIPKVWLEFKFDGTRVQLHFDKTKIIKEKKIAQASIFESTNSKENFFMKTYTRNLEETTHQYPDILEAAVKQINADSVILDGEAIGFNKETGEFLPFQETIQRKRKYDIAQTAKDIPLKYFVFDILYLNGKSLVHLPLRERRVLLDSVIKKGETIVPDEHIETEELDEMVKYFEQAKRKRLEGIIAKSPEDPYQAGARSYSWIKLKAADEKLLNDSIDLVVLGYYFGKGVRSKFGIGGFLVGVYDDKTDSFKTISKIGTGLTEEDFAKLKTMADKVKVSKQPINVAMDKMFKPDVFTAPKLVVEIGADEISISPSHTAKYALRFPRLLNFREDKPATQATTLKEIEKMFKNQRIRKAAEEK